MHGVEGPRLRSGTSDSRAAAWSRRASTIASRRRFATCAPRAPRTTACGTVLAPLWSSDPPAASDPRASCRTCARRGSRSTASARSTTRSRQCPGSARRPTATTRVPRSSSAAPPSTSPPPCVPSFGSRRSCDKLADGLLEQNKTEVARIKALFTLMS